MTKRIQKISWHQPDPVSTPGMIMTSATRSVMTMSQLEIEYERTSRPRDAARISNSTNLPVTKIVSPSLTNPLVNDGVSLDDVFTGRTYKMDEQEQHISITMSEMKKKTVHLERKNLRLEILRSKQMPSQNGRCTMERTGNRRLPCNKLVSKEQLS